MSSALVRQALELVDPEEFVVKKKRGARARRSAGQGQHSVFRGKVKKSREPGKAKEQIAEDNVKKLLALSKPTADPATAQKIVERAIKQKPLVDKIEVKVDEQKSILFPDEPSEPREPTEPSETFEDFEDNLFCS